MAMVTRDEGGWVIEPERGTWWRDSRGGAPVRVDVAIATGGTAVVVVSCAGEAGRECERIRVDAGVFERWFVPLERGVGRIVRAL